MMLYVLMGDGRSGASRNVRKASLLWIEEWIGGIWGVGANAICHHLS